MNMHLANTQPLSNQLSFAEPMRKHTSWRVGGPARQFYTPTDAQDLAAFIASLPKAEPVLWLGLGSNLLVRDGGFNGTVIAMQGSLAAIEVLNLDSPPLAADTLAMGFSKGRGAALPLGQRNSVHVGAGAACAKVARTCARAGLQGASFLAGIPGTMGGALAMNAGAFGGETWHIVTQVTTVDRAGQIQERSPSEYQITYRQVDAPAEEGFIGCVLELEFGDTQHELEAIRALLDKRSATQPTGNPSGGSTFRNPPSDYAARLIEACGLKGYQIGGAQVSQKHANFVINTGGATAQDIEALIMHMQATVEREQGVLLQPEVCIVGEAV